MASPNPNLSNTNASDIAKAEGSDQYLRVCTLLVSSVSGTALDLSQLRIKFAVKRSESMTPNTADIRVYNLEEQTAIRIRKEFTKVTLNAGYAGNNGVIFQGNIKQVILGRESATDTYIDIIAGDGDLAYNFAVVVQTLAAGATQMNQVNAAADAMKDKGVTKGHIGELPTQQLPRGKVMFGNARNYMRAVSQTTNNSWSIQDEKITFIGTKAYLPGERVVLTSVTGMVGTPEQTNEGINVKCLLNPKIKVGGRIVIDNKSIQQLKINLNITDPKQIAKSIPAPLTADGTYFVLVVEYLGDTRGIEWYCNLICLNIDVTTSPRNAVQVGAG